MNTIAGADSWRTWVVAMAIASSCAAPSRQLSSRVVEDPIVLPRRLAAATVRPWVRRYDTPATRGGADIRFRMGLTDRLEWTDILSLSYAILDDRPVGRAPSPVSLSVRAGATGVGYSTVEHLIVQPVLSLHVLKHVGDRWALSATGTADGLWTQDAWSTGRSRRWTSLRVNATVLRQITDRTAVGIAGWANQFHACLDLSCPWVTRGGGGTLHVAMRPRPWLTLWLSPYAGTQYGPTALGTPPSDPPPIWIRWLGVSGTAVFTW